MKWVGLLLLLSALAIGPAQAQVTTISGYDPRPMEIDGNVLAGPSCQICTFKYDLSQKPPVPADTCFTPFIPAGLLCVDWLDRQSGGLKFLEDPTGNDDPSILSPDSILSDGSTLPKQDIYRIGLANNDEYFWLSEERRSNNGTSGWHVFLTKELPHVVAGDPVKFFFKPGDLEIRICFPRGGSPENAKIDVFAVSDDPLPPPETIADDIWSDNVFTVPVAVAGFMMNRTTVDALDDALDAHEQTTPNYEPLTFAEAAIRLTDAGIDKCNDSRYVTVITRSSCTLTSDLKDIAGPIQYDFGGPTVDAGEPEVDCTTTVGFSAEASEGSPPYVFKWYDSLNGGAETLIRTSPPIGTAPFKDEPDIVLPAGHHVVRVEVWDDSGCTAAADVGEFDVYDPLGLDCDVPDPNCENKSRLSATATGGSGSYKYEWTDNDSPIGGNTSSFEYTFPNPTVPTDHTIKVVVTDVGRTDTVVCTKDCSKKVTVYKILGGSLATGAQTCGAFSFTATPTGGKAPFSYAWTLDGAPVGTDSATYSYAADADCADHEVCVTITDDRECTKKVCKKVHQEVTTTFP